MTIMIDGLHEQEHRVAQRAPEQHRDAAHRCHAHPLDDAVAQLGDEPEADERGAEDRDHDEHPGHEPVERVDARAGLGDGALEQRAEEDEVEDGLEDAHEQPDGLAEGQDEGPAEDQPGLAKGLHRKAPRGVVVARVER